MSTSAVRRLPLSGWGLCAAALLALPPGARAAPLPLDSSSDATPACIHARAEVRYANYGYDHWVIIHDGCNADADCVVRTNVNPNPIRVRVAQGKTKEVLTFRGSPASEFSAHVTCTLVK